MLRSPPKSYAHTWSRICELGDDPVGVGHQVGEQLELGGRQRDRAPGAQHLVADGVEFEVARDEPAVVGGAAGAAQDRPDAGDQLLQAERLGDVVVAARGQAVDLVLDAVLGGEEEHRQPVGGARRGARPASSRSRLDHREAVHVGQHHVEHHQVGALAGDGGQRVGAGGRGDDLEADEPQGGGEQLPDVGFVVDDQQAGLGRVHGVLRPDGGCYGWCGYAGRGCRGVRSAVRGASSVRPRAPRRPGCGVVRTVRGRAYGVRSHAGVRRRAYGAAARCRPLHRTPRQGKRGISCRRPVRSARPAAEPAEAPEPARGAALGDRGRGDVAVGVLAAAHGHGLARLEVGDLAVLGLGDLGGAAGGDLDDVALGVGDVDRAAVDELDRADGHTAAGAAGRAGRPPPAPPKPPPKPAPTVRAARGARAGAARSRRAGEAEAAAGRR